MRLSAGREVMSDELQALCFLAGANSIFYGEKLLTTGNPDVARDRALLDAPRNRAAGAGGARRAVAAAQDRCRARARSRLLARSRARARRRMQRDPAALKAALADLEHRSLQAHGDAPSSRRADQFLQ